MFLWGCGIELYGVEYGVWSMEWWRGYESYYREEAFFVADMLLNA
jgi:hypothetical protein